jgi:hypothetical protein
MKKENLKSEHFSNVEKWSYSQEKEYVIENLSFYIETEAISKRFNSGDSGWLIHSDDLTNLRWHLLDYIVEHFTIRELFIIFYANQCRGQITDGNEARKIAIQNINEVCDQNIHEAKRLKRKIWDMNPILIGLIVNLIQESELFWDAKKQEIIYPDFAEFIL